jgi:hypothetical protein
MTVEAFLGKTQTDAGQRINIGDTLLSVDDLPVDSKTGLKLALDTAAGRSNGGDSMFVRFRRKAIYAYDVEMPPGGGRLGVGLDPSLAITGFREGSWLEGSASIGDRITHVGDMRVENLSEMARAMRPSFGAKKIVLALREPRPCGTSGASTPGGATSGSLVTLSDEGEDDSRFDYVQAAFGGALPKDPVVAALSEPLDACSPLRNAEAARGKVLLVVRGLCDFAKKVATARVAGVTAVVVMNTEPGLVRIAPAQPRSNAVTDDPATAMVTQRAGKGLRRRALEAGPGGLRIRFETSEGDDTAKEWEALGRLQTHRAWPSDAKERRKMYFKLSRQHHPDKPRGSEERFECLTNGYQKANYYHDEELQKKMQLDEYLKEL